MRRALFLLMAVLCLAVLTGCGKKDWPEPLAEQDRFAWQRIKPTRKGDCLFVEAQLSGKFANLAGVSLQLQKMSGDCPDCPFDPGRIEYYSTSSKSLKQVGPYIRVVCCGIDPSSDYRIRLVGKNQHKALGEAVSITHIVPAGPSGN